MQDVGKIRRKTYAFLDLLLALLGRAEVALDGLHPLLQLLVEAAYLLLALLLQDLRPEHGKLLDLLDCLVAPGLFLLNKLVELLTKITFQFHRNKTTVWWGSTSITFSVLERRNSCPVGVDL